MRKLFLTCISVLLIKFAFTQSDTSAQHAVFFIPRADSNSTIYNGIEHLGYSASIEGIAYLETAEWQKGTIVYRDQPYQDVFLKYDLVRDEVILRHFNGFTGVTLFTPRIHAFTMEGSRFVNLPANNGKPGGIYQEILTGTISMYVKRSKKIDETLLPGRVERKIIQKNSFYLIKDGVLHTIRNEKDVMDLVKDKKAQVRSHFKGRGLKFRKNPEAYLITVVSYYNQSSR
jgi:hypothetical protein